MITVTQLAARQALIDLMAAVSILSPEQMADMVLDGLEERGYAIIKHTCAAKLRAALEPFARNVDALSLSRTLAHIEREHLWAARAALEETK